METFGKRDRVLENPKEACWGARKAGRRGKLLTGQELELYIFLKGEAGVTSPIIAKCLLSENWACTGHRAMQCQLPEHQPDHPEQAQPSQWPLRLPSSGVCAKSCFKEPKAVKIGWVTSFSQAAQKAVVLWTFSRFDS